MKKGNALTGIEFKQIFNHSDRTFRSGVTLSEYVVQCMNVSGIRYIIY
jgi:hypothetical protein